MSRVVLASTVGVVGSATFRVGWVNCTSQSISLLVSTYLAFTGSRHREWLYGRLQAWWALLARALVLSDTRLRLGKGRTCALNGRSVYILRTRSAIFFFCEEFVSPGIPSEETYFPHDRHRLARLSADSCYSLQLEVLFVENTVQPAH